jgi:hypothetical protein
VLSTPAGKILAWSVMVAPHGRPDQSTKVPAGEAPSGIARAHTTNPDAAIDPPLLARMFDENRKKRPYMAMVASVRPANPTFAKAERPQLDPMAWLKAETSVALRCQPTQAEAKAIRRSTCPRASQ